MTQLQIVSLALQSVVVGAVLHFGLALKRRNPRLVKRISIVSLVLLAGAVTFTGYGLLTL